MSEQQPNMVLKLEESPTLPLSLEGAGAKESSITKRTASRPVSIQHGTVLASVLALYFLLAFYRIDGQSLWGDEVLSLKYASPFGSFFSGSIWFRGQGPLYFALLHLWAKVGTSEMILRSLATVFGGCGLCLVYILGLRLFGRAAAVTSAVLFATSPFVVWYSQEVRYITLMVASSLLAMLTFHLVLCSTRRSRWIAYGISLILCFAAFVSNIFLCAAQGLYLVCSPSRRYLFRKWLRYQALVLILFVWWANDGHFWNLGGHWRDVYLEITEKTDRNSDSPLERSKGLSSGGSREFTPAVLPYTFFAFSSGFSLGPSTEELHTSRSVAALAPHALVLSALLVLFGGLFLVGIIDIWRRQPDTGLLVTLWLAVPMLVVFGISGLTDMTYNVRYVAMTFPAFVFIVVSGVLKFKLPVVRSALVCAVILVNGVALANYYYDSRYAREDARAAARYLASSAHSGDLILVLGSPTALRHYYKGNQPIVKWNGSAGANGPVVSQRLQKLKEDRGRLWIVAVRWWEADPKGNLKRALERTNSAIEQRHFSSVDVSCFNISDLTGILPG
jgi:mannosyltransferase